MVFGLTAELTMIGSYFLVGFFANSLVQAKFAFHFSKWMKFSFNFVNG